MVGSKGMEEAMLLQMVRISGFDPAASCTPSTRSAWLSYFLM